MTSRFVRKVRTASGAIAVQIVTQEGRTTTNIEHVGSAHTDAELGLLLQQAKQNLMPGQQAFDFDEVLGAATTMDSIPDWTEAKTGAIPGTKPRKPKPAPAPMANSTAKVLASPAIHLWELLTAAYTRLGFDQLEDDGFRAMVLARLIEPASKADTIRILDEIGAPHPSLRTLFRSLEKTQTLNYKDTLAKAMVGYRQKSRGLGAMVMYDLTSLHTDAKNEDKLRRIGFSKEHRIDPQIQVGLLVDPAGFPLELHMFPGNQAETTTILPVVEAFQARHGIADMVVVADAGMLSAGNLQAIEDAGYQFIVGSRLAKAPYDLQEHFDSKGNRFADGQILESSRVMGTGKNARERRVIYQWSAKRFVRDNRNINLMERRAMGIVEGTSQPRKARFVKDTGVTRELDQERIDKARMLAGLKGYVTNIPREDLDGPAVLAAYHDLWNVEASFRMTKSDLSARPFFHRTEAAIDAHLTVVFAALAIGRDLQERAGVSLKRIITEVKAVRSAKILVNGGQMLVPPVVPEPVQQILDALKNG